jgi:hypothetical protein
MAMMETNGGWVAGLNGTPDEPDRPEDREPDPAPAGYEAMPSAALVLQGGTVTFTYADSPDLPKLEPLTFRGNMFLERSMPMKLPTEISWLLETLGETPVMVVGKAIRQAIVGEKIDSVDCLISFKDLWAAYELLFPHGMQLMNTDFNALRITAAQALECQLGKPFQHNGCEYKMRLSGYKNMPERLKGNSSWRTPEGIYASTPFELRGSRIAFADLAEKRARLLCYKSSWVPQIAGTVLAKEGFTEF